MENSNIKKDNNEKFVLALYIYPIGSILCIMYSYYLYAVYNIQAKLLLFVLVKTILILMINCYLSYIDPIISFTEEIDQYSYVENNARVLLTTSLAIAMFFKFLGIKNKKIQYKIMIPVIMSFVFSSLILTLIWMPKGSGIYIRTLRDIKTVFLTSSIACLLITMFIILVNY